MTAAINNNSSSPPSPAASPAIAVASGAADVSATGVAESGDAAGAAGAFATLLKDQMAKQKTADAVLSDPALLPGAETVETEELQALGGELAALLPFLEAAGLVKTPTVPDEAQLAGAEELPADAAAATQLPAATADLTPLALPTPVPASASAPSIEMPQQAQTVASLFPGAGTQKPGATEIPSNTAAGAAIVADAPAAATVAATDMQAETPLLQDAKPGRQPDFAAQLAMAQGAAGPAGAARAATASQAGNEALAALDHLNPGQAQQASAQPGAAAMFAPADPHAAQRNALPALPVTTPVGTPQWSQALGDNIVWMSNRQESRAELVLTPPQMGRVEVSLSVNGDQASAIFTSANPTVRDALEAAMPRLREVLADAGIQLGQAQVGAENPRQSAQQEKNRDNFTAGRHDADIATTPLQTMAGSNLASAGLKMGRGLVDVFA